MKKRLIALMTITALSLTCLTGCGGNASTNSSNDSNASSDTTEAETSTTTSGDAITLKLASTKASENYMYHGMELFKEKAEELSGGTISVELYPASQLGGQTEIIEGMGMGTIEMAFLPPGVAEGFFPQISVPSTLFLCKDEEHALKIWNSDYSAGILDQMASAINVRCLDFSLEGARHVWTTVPVNSLSDLKNIKLRVPEAPTFVSSFEALGCNPTPMSFSEVYTGLQTNIIEGLENDTSSILSNNLQDLCKYCYKTNHAISTMCFMIADNTYNQLNDEQRNAIDTASAEASQWLNDQYYVELEKSETALKEAGVTFTVPSDEDRAKMEEILDPITQQNLNGLATMEDLDALRTLAD